MNIPKATISALELLDKTNGARLSPDNEPMIWVGVGFAVAKGFAKHFGALSFGLTDEGRAHLKTMNSLRE